MTGARRRPWGLNPWLFWIAALILAGLVGNVPYIGVPLLLATLFAAVAIWVRSPKATAANEGETSPPPPVGQTSPLPELWGEIEVQGESFRRDAVRRLFAQLGLPQGGVSHQVAVLEPEPTNQHDSNAIKVVVGGWHIGYVPAELTAEMIGAVRRAHGAWTTPVRIWADPRDGVWRARATLFPSIIERDRDFANEKIRSAAPPVSTVQPAFMPTGDTLDLTGLESIRIRIKGVGNYVGYDERITVGGTRYVLIREPGNAHDANAVCVATLTGRKVGYVSASRAQMIAPLLDQFSNASFLVGGKGPSPDDPALAVDVPKLEALRRYVKAQSVG